MGRKVAVGDGSGSRSLAYNEAGKVTGESYTAGLLNGLSLTHSYDSLLRRDGLTLKEGATPLHNQGFAYGDASRLSGVTAGTDTVEYGYLTNSPLVGTMTFQRSGNTVMTTNKDHDFVNRLAATETVSGNTTVSHHEYDYTALSQRNRVDLADGGHWVYQYNSKGEVINGTRFDAGNNAIGGLNLGYAFDGIGNRQSTTVDGVTDAAYTANALNQYTDITTSVTVTPVHDADGNLVDDGTKTLEWDGENRLKSVRRKSDNALIATYTYDDQSRRVRKETTPLAPQGASDEVFMWDGWNVVGELSNNAGTFTPVRYYTWGSDLSGTQQGAGGVGGLVMEKDAATGEVYFPCFDGNGNVTNLVAAGSGTVAAAYEYDPFGKVVSSSGSYAGANPYRFSTKPVDAETGYSYYGYRFYNPVDGRWINRDPLGDSAFFNSQVRNKTEKEYISLKDAATHSQYVFLKNNGISSIDSHGLKRWLVDYLHTSVVVESWNDKCCRTGYLQIDFGPAIGWGALLLIPDFGFWCPGVVVISPTEKPSGSPINSTCKQDQILIDTAELLSVNPPSYSLWAFNCRHFSAVILGVGL